MKTFLSFKRRWREARMFARAMANADHPILAQIIPIRRCNLACTYCNEFDKDSLPVPTSEMLRRIDKLGALGTSIVTFSGGEPTLHPDLDCSSGMYGIKVRLRQSYKRLPVDARENPATECGRA